MSDSDDFSDAGEEFPNEVNTVNKEDQIKSINCLVRSPVINVDQESVTEILEHESDVVLQIINPKRGRETMLTMMMRLIIPHFHLP